MLRRAIIAWGILAIAVAVVLFAAHVVLPLAIYLVVNGSVILGAIIFERRRYRPRVNSSGPWQRTGERFVDPGTGLLMEVRYNPRSGQRDYVAVGPASREPGQER